MSTTEHDESQTVETSTRHLVRMFEVPLAAGWDGRTLDALVVPYNRATVVADPPRFEPYSEMFLAGAFDRQLSAAGRDKVLLNFEHEQGIRGVIGQSLSLVEREDGLHGSFGVHENSDGEKALAMINSGLLTGLSAEFVPTSSRRINGVVQRVRAHLDKVSLCRFPAYAAAQVLAVREEPDPDETDTPVPPPSVPPPVRDPDVDARMASLGYEPLIRAETTDRRWDATATRYEVEQYAAAALIDRGEVGFTDYRERYALPVLEPDGTINVNALVLAADTLVGSRRDLPHVSLAQRAAAARKLIRYYNRTNLDVPTSLRQLAVTA